MLWLVEFIVALIVALAFGWLLYSLMQPGPHTKEDGMDYSWLFFLFILLLLPTWSGGIWLRPMGPALFGIRIFNFLLMGLLVTLVIGTLMAATTNNGRGPYMQGKLNRP